MSTTPTVAYFSMEIALEPRMRTYAGGLGILAGDSLRAAADLALPLIGVTLLYRKGYARQELDESGWQTEHPFEWNVAEYARELEPHVTITLAGREVSIRAWKREITGAGGATIPVILLDTDVPDNAEEDRSITHFLYGGDRRYRLAQEVVLGVGGVRMLRALGYRQLERFHMNEGHSALLAAELLREEMKALGKEYIDAPAVQAVRAKCIFTTHTPVPAGHDRFEPALVHDLLGRQRAFEESGLFEHEGVLNMTYAALNLSHYVNGVAKRHGEISRQMFGEYPIDSITNGVHAATWICPAFQELFDVHIQGWRHDSASLRFGLHLLRDNILAAHARAKQALISHANQTVGADMQEDVFTIGCARRAAAYKRLDLILSDRDRLQAIAERVGPLQILFAGKAHPGDHGGKLVIQNIFRASRELKGGVRVAFLPGYDMELARLLTSGCDLWLNNPRPPEEASGTSGMKAALNGIPSLSVLDGWWIEGWIENVTGWAIGDLGGPHDDEADAASLYDKLERIIMPLFYQDRRGYASVMRHTIALNGSFFNTERMMSQYVVRAYFR